MSLSDYLRYRRALKGGLTPWEIAELTGVPAGAIHLLEVKHRRVGEDDTLLGKLAEFYGVSLEEMTGRREAYRKRLTAFLDEGIRDAASVDLRLEDGEVISGVPVWFSREAVALQPEGESEGWRQPYIVQRSWVADWRQRGSEGWEVGSSLVPGD